MKRHRWFRDYDWEDVINRRLRPPIIPKVTFEGDTHNFDEYPELDPSEELEPIDPEHLKLFDDF